MRNAFSLVELSIVLVILGLLTGGILAGQSLIRAAELRSISSDQQRYFAAIQAFRDKYMALPGDMTNATAFWGKDNTRCTGHTGTAATPGTCNGNGNGNFDADNIEGFRGWQQLALAGLIEGSFQGYISPVDVTTPLTPGTHVPASKIGNRFWQLIYFSQSDAVNYELGFSGVADIRNNYLFFAATSATYWNSTGALKPEEAWNVDTKMDDGRPAFGRVRTRGLVGCTDVTTSAAQYNLTNTANTCPLGFVF